MSRLAAIILGVLAFVSLYVTAAQAVVLVRDANDLTNDKMVQAVKPAFTATAAASYVYKQCGVQFKTTPELIAFQKVAYKDTLAQYIKAFHDAYVTRVNAEPEQKMVDSYAALITKQQQQAISQMDAEWQKRGCTGHVQSVANYVEALYNAEQKRIAFEQQQKLKAAAEADAKMENTPAVTSPIVPTTPTEPSESNSTTPTPGSN